MYRMRNLETSGVLKIMVVLLLFLIGTSAYKSVKIKSMNEASQLASEYIEAMAVTNQQINAENKFLKEQLDYEIDAISELEEKLDMLNKELTLSHKRIEELEIEKNQFLDGVVDYSDERQFRKGYIDMTELEILERITEAEATGGSVKQKMNVARAVLNRVDAKHFPNTIKEVVFDKPNGAVQYTPISDGRYWKVEITESTKQAVNNVLNGECSHDALYFCARKDSSENSLNWFDRALREIFNDGIHSFFIEK